MRANETGFLIYFDERRRRDLIKERVEGSYEAFTDALSVHDWKVRRHSVALLGFTDSTIDYIAIAKKGRRVATSKSSVEFSGMIDLDAIQVKAIESRLNKELRGSFITASQGTGSVIPEPLWTALIAAVKAERPKLAEEIDRLLSLRRYSGYRLFGEAAEILLQEREALGISLDIFSGSNKLRDRVLTEWAPPEGALRAVDESSLVARLPYLEAGYSSFLKGIPRRYLQEEAAIQHDLFNWPGMSALHEAGVSVFQQGDRRLEVVYANRNALERTLGVDLIYYNQAYELFMLVQYKLMRKEYGIPMYRPDNQLAAEMERMDKFYHSYRTNAPIQSNEQYRLTDDGFMMKLCPNEGLQPASGKLIKGMYISREYMHFLLGPRGPKGERGGTQINFETAPRYLTNSQFASSVHSGWIGSRGTQSDGIHRMIRQFYETNRAVMLASERREKTDSWSWHEDDFSSGRARRHGS